MHWLMTHDNGLAAKGIISPTSPHSHRPQNCLRDNRIAS